MAKLKIVQLGLRDRDGQYGPYQQWVLTTDDNKTHYVIKKAWNADWKAGMTVDVEFKKNGRYWNIVPPEAGGSAPAPGNDVLVRLGIRLKAIEAKLDQVLDELKQVGAPTAAQVAYGVGPEDEVPPHEDGDRPEEGIPF